MLRTRYLPLRQRPADAIALAEHFIRKYSKANGMDHRPLSEAAKAQITSREWPGNVRELENLVRRLAALYVDEVISLEIVQNELNLADRGNFSSKPGPADIVTVIESDLAELFREYEPNLPPAGVYQRIIDKVEVPLISTVLTLCAGNQIKAAELLGLNRNTLRKKIRGHGIEIVKQSRQLG